MPRINDEQLLDILKELYSAYRNYDAYCKRELSYSFPYDEGSPRQLTEALNKFFNEKA